MRLARPTTPADVGALSIALRLEGNQPLSDRLLSFQRARGLSPDGLAGPALLRLAGASNQQLPEAVSRALARPFPELEGQRLLSARGEAVARALEPLGLHVTLGAERFDAEPSAIVRALTTPSALPRTFDAASSEVLGQISATGTSGFTGAEGRATTALRFFAGA
ncbi:MAG: hypothetical protein Q8S33_38735 [Myxococcales bacterium]|nr:hypothetical protein [Myxococcales bacterium]